MKTKKIIFALYALCVSAIFTVSTAFAQAPTAYKPGDPISITVKFGGEDVEKINQIHVSFGLVGAIPDDQAGFLNWLNVANVKQVGPGTFEVSTTIPPNVASGKFTLNQVAAGSGTLGLVFVYNPPGLPPITIKIDNPERLKKPELKSIEKNP